MRLYGVSELRDWLFGEIHLIDERRFMEGVLPLLASDPNMEIVSR